MQRMFGEFSFFHVCQISPEMDETGFIKTYLPQNQYRKRDQYSLNAFGHGPFCRFRVPKTLTSEGVYILTVEDEPFYVGECQHLAKRYNMGYGQISPRNCYQGGQPTNCRLNNLIYQTIQDGKRVDLWFQETNNRFEVEHCLIQRLNVRQKWNRKD